MKKFAIIVVLLIAAGKVFAQQDAQFSQYIFNGLYINPGYAGYKEDLYVNSFFRSQWTGLEGAPTTFSATVDGAIKEGKVGLGLMLQHDQIGAQSNIAAYGNYAYRIQIGEQQHSKLALGLGFGFIQTGIDGSKLNPVQSFDTYVPTGYQSVLLPDARLGAFYSNDNFFVGASVDNLLAQHMHNDQASATLIPVPKPHECFTVGGLIDVDYQMKFKPSILIKDAPGVPTSMDINAFVLLNEKLWLGATYRTAVDLYAKPNLQQGMQKLSAVVGMAEFFINENFRIGYAYDASMNKLGSYGYGSHELSISIMLKQSPYVDRTRNCYF